MAEIAIFAEMALLVEMSLLVEIAILAEIAVLGDVAIFVEVAISGLTGVSMRKNTQFTLEPYCRKLLGCPGARDLIFVDFGPFPAQPMSPCERVRNFLSNRVVESFWGALGLEIRFGFILVHVRLSRCHNEKERATSYQYL